jgi:hypothetical protein
MNSRCDVPGALHCWERNTGSQWTERKRWDPQAIRKQKLHETFFAPAGDRAPVLNSVVRLSCPASWQRIKNAIMVEEKLLGERSLEHRKANGNITLKCISRRLAA